MRGVCASAISSPNISYASNAGQWPRERWPMRAEAQSLAMRAALPLLLLLTFFGGTPAVAQVSSLDSIGITVSDLDRAIDFYTRVLTFEKESEREVAGSDYEHLFGVFGIRLRVARLR